MNTQRVLAILGLLACLPLANAADQDLQARFEKSLKDARSISNVEIDWLDQFSIRDQAQLKFLKMEEHSRTIQYSFSASGPKQRATSKIISSSFVNPRVGNVVSAFDGTFFCTYADNNHTMTRSSVKALGSISESRLNPLTVPFIFLSNFSDDCRRCVLRSADIASENFAKGVTLPRGQKSDGLLEFSMPGLPLGKQPTSWNIAIDQAGDSFTPKTIKYVVPGHGFQTIYMLLNYTNLGAYQFPSRIEWVTSSYPPTSPPSLQSTGMVSVISARIPNQIADPVFRLDREEKLAQTIWDMDTGELIYSVYQESHDKFLREQPNIYDESADGSKQVADALDAARKEHRHVLLQFGANWCVPCHQLHKLFETDKAIAEELEKGYVVVMIDVNNGHNKDTDTKYGHPTRFGLPNIVVLDAEGRQLTTQNTGKLVGGDHHTPENMMTFLKRWAPTR